MKSLRRCSFRITRGVVDFSVSKPLRHSFFVEQKTTIGNGKEKEVDILLRGPGIVSDHAVINNTGKGDVFLDPKYGAVLHNGKPIEAKIRLNHGDR